MGNIWWGQTCLIPPNTGLSLQREAPGRLIWVQWATRLRSQSSATAQFCITLEMMPSQTTALHLGHRYASLCPQPPGLLTWNCKRHLILLHPLVCANIFSPSWYFLKVTAISKWTWISYIWFGLLDEKRMWQQGESCTCGLGHMCVCNVQSVWQVCSFCWQYYDFCIKLEIAYSQDKKITVWQSMNSRPSTIITSTFQQSITDLAWSSDGQFLAASSTDGTLAVIQVTFVDFIANAFSHQLSTHLLSMPCWLIFKGILYSLLNVYNAFRV